MTEPGRVLLALVASVSLHAAAVALILPLLKPRPVPQQLNAQSQLVMSTLQVKRNRAEERQPAALSAPETSSAGGQVSNGAVPLTKAQPQPVTGVHQQAAQPQAQVVKALPGTTDVVSLIHDAGRAVSSVTPNPQSVSTFQPVANADISSSNPVATLVSASVPIFDAKEPTAPVSQQAPSQRPSAPRQDALHPGAPTLAALPPPATAITSGQAWSGMENLTLDAQSIKTLGAFLQPDTGAAHEVRDQMIQIMTAPSCARVHTIFDLNTGALELRGHVPATTARAPLLAAMQAQIGAGLLLRDAMRILPEPQCSMLDEIADLGLPQSEEQLTDADLVGENAQVRSYAFTEGDRLTIDLTGPDYPAYVYVDYFDAEGQVIHLRPNAQSELLQVAAAHEFSIGRGDDLDLRIAAPFGQDIAVAFAASVPLYDGVRPLVEPAVAYLEMLREAIREKRQTHSDFRGEWVYLFVVTSSLND